MEKRSMLTRPLVVLLLASLCNLLWGSAVPFINLGYRFFNVASGDAATQILFAGCRFALAGALTILFASIGERKFVRPKKGNADLVVKLALTQTIAQYVFFYIGVANTTSVKAAIIQGLGAFVSILIACFVFRSERMNKLKWIGGLVGVAGVVIVNLDTSGLGGGVKLTGEGFLLISMTASACSAGLIKRFGQKDSPVALSGWQFMLGGAIMAAAGFAMGGRLHMGNPLGLAVLLYLAALSAVAYTLWAVLLKVNPVSHVAVYMFLQPIFGVLLSLLLVDSAANVPLLRYGAALVLVCASIVIVGRGQRKDA